MSATLQDPSSTPAVTTALPAHGAAAAVTLLVGGVLLAPLYHLLVTSGWPELSGLRDVATILLALSVITAIGWCSTLRLHHRQLPVAGRDHSPSAPLET